MPARWAPGAAILAASILVAACMLDDQPVLSVTNATDGAIRVIVRYPAADTIVEDALAPGLVAVWDRMGTCEDGILIATDADGVELFRAGPPICRGDRYEVRAP